MKPKWYERLGEVIGIVVYEGMPCIAAAVIGSRLTWFNFAVLHHRLWLSLLYGFWLPLLLTGFHYWFYRGFGNNTRRETGCMYSLLWLTLFFILWPVVLKAHYKSERPGPEKRGAITMPRKSQSPGPTQRTA